MLNRTFGCVRYVWNWALETRTTAYRSGGAVTNAELSRMLTALKARPETAWLHEVSSVPLQQALRHQARAMTNFFEKRAQYPRFKSKRGRAAATFTGTSFKWDGASLRLAKLSTPLRIRWSRPLPAEPSSVTVSRDRAGRWHVSCTVDDDTIHPLPTSTEVVGVDAGLHSLVTLSTGEKVTNPRHERQDREKLARAQRELARKQKGSNNREKQRRKVARIHARIADRRKDHLHKLTTRLVRENQTVVIEDLNVRGMVRNHSLARAISDAAWSELRRQLEYKTAWYGRELVVVDRFFPSSRLCSDCGHRATLTLSDREWACTECGTVHDRDVNAAKNLVAVGSTVKARGEGVRPNRRQPETQPSLKQERD